MLWVLTSRQSIITKYPQNMSPRQKKQNKLFLNYPHECSLSRAMAIFISYLFFSPHFVPLDDFVKANFQKCPTPIIMFNREIHHNPSATLLLGFKVKSM